MNKNEKKVLQFEMKKWQNKDVKTNKEHTKEMNKNAKTVGRVTRITFNEIKNENEGIKLAFICDRLKDRDKAIKTEQFYFCLFAF